MKKRAVLAIGGNSLIKDKKHQTVPDQYACVQETMKHVVPLIKQKWNLVISHGNGPQIGFILHRAEYCRKKGLLHSVPLDSCGADTQGAIGYNIVMALRNELKIKKIDKEVAALVTQVVVDLKDPAFKKPSKPIGSYYTKKEAQQRQKEDNWIMKEDSGRGWRRVVASPKPQEIVNLASIKTLLTAGHVVIAGGGGGVPVARDKQGLLKPGVEVVIDKDLTSALLANEINAELLIISTAVEHVYINFDKSNQKKILKMNIAQAQKHIQENQFAAGSMLPKIQAAIKFLEQGGKKVIITCPEAIGKALRGKSGTQIIP